MAATVGFTSKLSAELRVEVYQYVLSFNATLSDRCIGHRPKYVDVSKNTRDTDANDDDDHEFSLNYYYGNQVSLLRVNRQIHLEAGKVFRDINKFILHMRNACIAPSETPASTTWIPSRYAGSIVRTNTPTFLLVQFFKHVEIHITSPELNIFHCPGAHRAHATNEACHISVDDLWRVTTRIPTLKTFTLNCQTATLFLHFVSMIQTYFAPALNYERACEAALAGLGSEAPQPTEMFGVCVGRISFTGMPGKVSIICPALEREWGAASWWVDENQGLNNDVLAFNRHSGHGLPGLQGSISHRLIEFYLLARLDRLIVPRLGEFFATWGPIDPDELPLRYSWTLSLKTGTTMLEFNLALAWTLIEATPDFDDLDYFEGDEMDWVFREGEFPWNWDSSRERNWDETFSYDYNEHNGGWGVVEDTNDDTGDGDQDGKEEADVTSNKVSSDTQHDEEESKEGSKTCFQKAEDKGKYDETWFEDLAEEDKGGVTSEGQKYNLYFE